MGVIFAWTIPNFSCLGSRQNGYFVDSPSFTTSVKGEIKWHLRLFPRAVIDGQEYVSIFQFTNVPVLVKMSFDICNGEREVIVKQRLPEVLCYRSGKGCRKFVLRSFVQNADNNVLDNDVLRIICRITFKTSLAPIKSQSKAKSEVDRFIDGYESLFNIGEFSDVSIVCQGRVLRVHKCILALKSPVFAAMFRVNMREKLESVVEIYDVSYDVLAAMLRFIYAGKTIGIDGFVADLAIAADKYLLNSLVKACEEMMTEGLNLDNFIDYLWIADMLFMDKLKEKAIQFAVERGKDATNKPDFHLLPMDIVVRICPTFATKKVKYDVDSCSDSLV